MSEKKNLTPGMVAGLVMEKANEMLQLLGPGYGVVVAVQVQTAENAGYINVSHNAPDAEVVRKFINQWADSQQQPVAVTSPDVREDERRLLTQPGSAMVADETKH